MIIRVTKKHIDEGRAGSCRSCPVALALREAGFIDPQATGSILRDGRRKICETPYEVYHFMCEFDSYLYAGPFEFEIPDAA